MAWKSMQNTASDMLRTDLGGVSGSTTDGTTVDVIFSNDGSTRLAAFAEWDVILQYWEATGTPGYQVTRLAYNPGTPGSLGDNEWAVEGTYYDSGATTADAFDPGILNPDEYIKITMKLNPIVGTPNANVAFVSPPNGGSRAAVGFTRTP